MKQLDTHIEGGLRVRTAFRNWKCTGCKAAFGKLSIRVDYLVDAKDGSVGTVDRHTYCVKCAEFVIRSAHHRLLEIQKDPDAFKLVESL